MKYRSKYESLKYFADHQTYRMILAFLLGVVISSCQTHKTSTETEISVLSTSPEVVPALRPIDWRTEIASESFKKIGEGEWVSPKVNPPFPFDELIYSWNIQLQDKEAFRLYLKVEFEPGDATSWLYAGFWGEVKDPVVNREKPKFDRGWLDMDWLKLNTKAVSYQYKVVDSGTKALSLLPSFKVITTDNHPTPRLAERFSPVYQEEPISVQVFDIPLRLQMDSYGNPMKSRCQSAALASALEYYGKALNLEDIVSYIHDPEYDYPGLWPRVIGAANEFGFDGYVDRIRDWNAVRNTLSQKKIILCSIRMAEGDCKAPPYPEMGNHIVVLNGITEDGRVVVTDSVSALWKDHKGYLCQWLLEDFEKVWMKTKGGVSMVICPPEDFRENPVKNLPDFPTDRNLLLP